MSTISRHDGVSEGGYGFGDDTIGDGYGDGDATSYGKGAKLTTSDGSGFGVHNPTIPGNGDGRGGGDVSVYPYQKLEGYKLTRNAKNK